MGNNIFSVSSAFAASSCGAAALPQPTHSFGFLASHVIVANTCGGRLFVNLSGEAATTAMGYVTCGVSPTFQDLQAPGIGLSTTSTTTAAGASPLYGITAYGP